jgi:heat-inducible transcriptional repressor
MEHGRELLNIFIAEGDEIFDISADPDEIVLGSAELLADQPEFSSNARMRGLLNLTERRDVLREALLARQHAGLSITIGSEHDDTRLADFTLVTSSYRLGDLTASSGSSGRRACRTTRSSGWCSTPAGWWKG